jgi:hypothetical protein
MGDNQDIAAIIAAIIHYKKAKKAIVAAPAQRSFAIAQPQPRQSAYCLSGRQSQMEIRDLIMRRAAWKSY